MKKILIAAKNEKICNMYKEMLDENTFAVTTMTEAGSIRYLSVSIFSVIFISLPLSDETGIKLIDDLHKRSDVPIGVMIKPDAPDSVIERLLADNAYLLKKPVPRSSFTLAAELLSSFSENNADMRAKIAELERKNNEIKLMSRAKLVLIETNGMTENEAHRHILRTAMNRQLSIDAVCHEIIEQLNDN